MFDYIFYFVVLYENDKKTNIVKLLNIYNIYIYIYICPKENMIKVLLKFAIILF